MKATAALLAPICAACALACGGAAQGAGGEVPAPRHLLVQVRDTPPQGPASIRHGADGSYSVSTGSGADRDDRGAQAPDNASVLSTSNRIRRVHVLEGERVRVDLPAVQSLQFHLGAGGAAGAAKGSGGAPASAGSAGGIGSGASAAAAGGPAASGVVYFEAVSAFAARFLLAGRAVHIELTPLHRGDVSAPYAASGGGNDRPVTVAGHLGEWIALGDTAVNDPAKSLSATAEPAAPASVWVRVDPEPAEAAQ